MKGKIETMTEGESEMGEGSEMKERMRMGCVR